MSRPVDDRLRVLARERDNFNEVIETSRERISEFSSIRPRASEKSQVKALDPDTIERVNRANKKLSLFLYHLANEPSVGLYHVNEHVCRSVPRVVNLKNSLKSKVKVVTDLSLDMQYTMDTVKPLQGLDTFSSINKLIQESTRIVDAIQRGVPPTTLAQTESLDVAHSTQALDAPAEAKSQPPNNHSDAVEQNSIEAESSVIINADGGAEQPHNSTIVTSGLAIDVTRTKRKKGTPGVELKPKNF